MKGGKGDQGRQEQRALNQMARVCQALHDVPWIVGLKNMPIAVGKTITCSVANHEKLQSEQQGSMPVTTGSGQKSDLKVWSHPK